MDFLAKPVDPDHLLLLVSARARAAPDRHREPPDEGGAGGPPRRAAAGRRGSVAAQGVRLAAAGRGHRRDRAARRGERHRQGAVRALAARAQPARRRAVRRDQLRRDPREPARDRALRLREGRLHRRGRRASPASSRWPTAARSSSTRSATCRSRCRPRSCARSRRSSSSASAAPRCCQVDVRLVAATNRGLRAAVAARRFREDLYFRLSVFPITVPPLRDRPGDIPVLARYFVDRFCRDLKKRPLVLSPQALEQLQAYRWPGNVRELQNCIERAVILADGETLLPRHLNLSFAAPLDRREPPSPLGARRSVGHAGRGDAPGDGARSRRRKIEEVLDEADGNKGRAAELLQISYKIAAREAQGTRHRVESAPGLASAACSRRNRHAAPRRFRPSVTSVTDLARRRSPSAARSAAVRRRPSCRGAIASSTSATERSATAGSGPIFAMSAASASRSAAGIDAARHRDLGGHQHPVADRFAVAEAAVFGHRLERVAGGVAEVQRAPRARSRARPARRPRP